MEKSDCPSTENLPKGHSLDDLFQCGTENNGDCVCLNENLLEHGDENFNEYIFYFIKLIYLMIGVKSEQH